ncbi:uncharacterized protein LOC105931663 [Fundulus heteroclitus]|uniref:uncharacterized protein LOC105931663 n=1 Tax=Fundulus heteroclitus TaxID=8078 RepID=UPI00165B39A1|nr:uncharacterized protein LOC105931663 [Fundulus heteroclitus]
MAKVLFTVVALVASLVFAESLVCNKCTFGLVGICLNMQNETCASGVTNCYTDTLTFNAISDFRGLSMQGCAANTTLCNSTFENTLVSVRYKYNETCCTQDRCNKIVLDGAPSTKMTFTAAVSAAILASVWGGIF